MDQDRFRFPVFFSRITFFNISQKDAKLDINFFLSCQVLVDFYTFFQIFCPWLEINSNALDSMMPFVPTLGRNTAFDKMVKKNYFFSLSWRLVSSLLEIQIMQWWDLVLKNIKIVNLKRQIRRPVKLEITKILQIGSAMGENMVKWKCWFYF